MEAARILAKKGHKVTIFEKEKRLGGQMYLAMIPPHKADMIGPFMDYLEAQLKKSNIEVKLNTESNLESLIKFKPDLVVVATGAKPILSNIQGIKENNAITSFDVLAGKVDTGKTVVIVGGGSAGCETAEYLYTKGKKVTVIEMLADLAADMGPRDKLRLLTRITKLPINFRTNTKCTEIKEGCVLVSTKENSKETIDAETVVLAIGVTQNNEIYEQLRAHGIEVRIIGDAWHVGRIVGAIGEGFELGWGS